MLNLNVNKISKANGLAKSNKIEAHQTNPFGVSFKGNVLTADVFQKAGGDNLVKRISNKSKMLRAAVASVNSVIGTRLDTIVNHGRKIGERVSNLWRRAQSIEINISPKAIIERTEGLAASAKNSIVSRIQSINHNSSLKGLSVDELAGRFESKLALMGEVR